MLTLALPVSETLEVVSTVSLRVNVNVASLVEAFLNDGAANL